MLTFLLLDQRVGVHHCHVWKEIEQPAAKRWVDDWFYCVITTVANFYNKHKAWDLRMNFKLPTNTSNAWVGGSNKQFHNVKKKLKMWCLVT